MTFHHTDIFKYDINYNFYYLDERDRELFINYLFTTEKQTPHSKIRVMSRYLHQLFTR